MDEHTGYYNKIKGLGDNDLFIVSDITSTWQR
jgi:hypothetical protein